MEYFGYGLLGVAAVWLVAETVRCFMGKPSAWDGLLIRCRGRLSLVAVLTALLAAVAAAVFLGGFHGAKALPFLQRLPAGIAAVSGAMRGDVSRLAEAYPDAWLAQVPGILLPLLASGAVLSFLAGVSRLPYLPRGEYFIFDRVDSRSLSMARNLVESGECSPRQVVFLRCDGSDREPRQLGARVYAYTEAELLITHPGMRRAKLRFFFLDENSDVGFQRMQALLEETQRRRLFRTPLLARWNLGYEQAASIFRQELYLLSDAPSAPLLIDHLRRSLMDGKKRKKVFAHTELRLADRCRSVVYDLLEKQPLYSTAQDSSIRVLVVGFGKVGQEFFRAAASFGQLARYGLSFCLCDREIDTRWRELKARLPECDEGLTVKLHNQWEFNALTDDLTKLLEENRAAGTPFTYILLSLGDDERNTEVALQLRRYYRGLWWKGNASQPYICVNIRDTVKAAYLRSLCLQPLGDGEAKLHVFGSDGETFSPDLLLSRKLWTAARCLHRAIGTGGFALWQEYDRRACIACAAHAPYYRSANEGYPNLQRVEHRRWMQYVRCEGMQSIDWVTAKAYQQQLGTHVERVAMLNPCLRCTEEEMLDKLYLFLGNQDSPQRKAFTQRDKLVVYNIPRLCRILETGEPERLRLPRERKQM